jgi:hypothetical protein
MEVLTSDYKINEIIPFADSELNVDLSYLWIWYADKIPPHLGISTENNYFSLKSNGKDENLPVSSIISLIKQKKIKTLAVELVSIVDLRAVVSCFDKYTEAKANKATCLWPIKDVLERPHPSKLEFLLDELDFEGDIKRYIGFNLDESFKGIPFYTIEDIHARLELLARES